MVDPKLSRSLLFALATGVLFTPWFLALSPALGGTRALAAYLVLAVVVHPLATVAGRRGKVATAVAAGFGGALGVWIWLGAPSVLFVALLGTLVVGLVRGTLTAPEPPLIGLLRETTVAGLALPPAIFMFDDRLVGTGIALWWFWLIQSGAAAWTRTREREHGREEAPPRRGLEPDAAPGVTADPLAEFDALSCEATRLLDRLESPSPTPTSLRERECEPESEEDTFEPVPHA